MRPRALAVLLAVVASCSVPASTKPPPTGITPAGIDRAGVMPAQRSFPPRLPAPRLRPSPSLGLHPAPWAKGLDELIGGEPVSVSVAIGGRLRASHLGDVPRIPASNEKLLLSMALLDQFGPRYRIPTVVEALRVRRGVVRGNLWLVGHGDPEVDDETLARLAERIAAAGVHEVRGSVEGDTSFFRRGRWARGWHRIALSFISVPTALTFDHNGGAGGFVFDPEREAAAALTADLQALGIRVAGPPRAGAVPGIARPIARVRSSPLQDILRRQNVSSLNLDAEVLDKLLGGAVFGAPGTIAKGAQAIQDWARALGVRLVAHDAAGLSYANRITTDQMVRLLTLADACWWGRGLRTTLPQAGVGTLSGRLSGRTVRAKTGTLIQGVSALSGWVWLERSGRWAAFSILSRGLAKDQAVALEDAIVRFLAER